MKQTCPFCNAPLDIPDEYAGKEVTCAACNEQFFADGAEPFPPAPARPRQMVDSVTPSLFRQFTSIEQSMKEVRGKIAAQTWTCVCLFLFGVAVAVFGGYISSQAIEGGALMIGGGLCALAALLYAVYCISYWAVYKIACWRTVAINSGVPVVYSVDPRRPR